MNPTKFTAEDLLTLRGNARLLTEEFIEAIPNRALRKATMNQWEQSMFAPEWAKPIPKLDKNEIKHVEVSQLVEVFDHSNYEDRWSGSTLETLHKSFGQTLPLILHRSVLESHQRDVEEERRQRELRFGQLATQTTTKKLKRSIDDDDVTDDIGSQLP